MKKLYQHSPYYTLWKVPFEEMLTRHPKSMAPLDSELYSEIEANNLRIQMTTPDSSTYIKMIPIENLTFDQILLLNKDVLERIKQII